MNHTETNQINASDVYDIPFTLAEGTDTTINSSFIFFLIVSALVLFLSLTKQNPIFKVLNLAWFGGWTVAFSVNNFHPLFIIIMFILTFVPIFTTFGDIN